MPGHDGLKEVQNRFPSADLLFVVGSERADEMLQSQNTKLWLQERHSGKWVCMTEAGSTGASPLLNITIGESLCLF